MKEKIEKLVIAVLIPLFFGQLSSLISRGGFEVYQTLEKTDVSPPAALFPIVWTVLYILMGISSFLIWESDKAERTRGLALYGLQLFLNFLWAPLFFRCGQVLEAFFLLILLLAVVTAMTVSFFRIRPAAGLLQLPYILWLLFAGYLNLSVFLQNGPVL